MLTDLGQFTGTLHWYKHSLVPSITYTDGVKYVADEAGAYWLIDLIAAYQHDPKVKVEPFQVWKLRLNGPGAVISCEDGNGNVVHSHEIGYTDFPQDIEIWMTDHVILLPSEY